MYHYSELFWSAFSRIPYSFQMRENVDQNNSEYGHVLRSVTITVHYLIFFGKNIVSKKLKFFEVLPKEK